MGNLKKNETKQKKHVSNSIFYILSTTVYLSVSLKVSYIFVASHLLYDQPVLIPNSSNTAVLSLI